MQSPTWQNSIPFIPPVSSGIVIKVYDGDTIWIATHMPYDTDTWYRFSVRLNGIDCPEMKSNDEYEKECAKIAQEKLSAIILGKEVQLRNLSLEKYGRLLADVYYNDINNIASAKGGRGFAAHTEGACSVNMSEYMLKECLAVCYNGGTKITPKNWMEYYLKGELGETINHREERKTEKKVKRIYKCKNK